MIIITSFCSLNKYGGQCPLKLLVDVNTLLPHANPLCRSKGFNKHSSVLYDFMCNNNLIAVHLMSSQSVSYTCFCHRRNIYSWLDHVLCFRHDFNNVLKCKILDPVADNYYNHLMGVTVFL